MTALYDDGVPAGATVIDLTPVNPASQALTPDTIVTCINRGREVLVRKFDALDYPLHPHAVGFIKMPYGAALHFQRHCTVPGTRDAFSGAEQSFIGILGVDPPEWCEPFTDEQCERFGIAIEAIDRTGEEEAVTTASVSSAVAAGRVPVRGQRGGKPTRPVRQGKDGKNGSKLADAMAPPDGRNDAQDEIDNDAAAAAAAGEV